VPQYRTPYRVEYFNVINKPKLDAVPPKDLQLVFETALGEIQNSQGAGQPPAHRTPIFTRPATGVPSQAQSEKRAVSDAAYALAQLWRISPHPAR
jgi:hypothetical protein